MDQQIPDLWNGVQMQCVTQKYHASCVHMRAHKKMDKLLAVQVSHDVITSEHIDVIELKILGLISSR